MKKSFIPHSLLLVTMLALLASASANAKDYLIEVVLFETVAARNASTGGLYYPKLRSSIRLGTEQATAAQFLTVEQGLTLAENAATIAASERYRLLRHLSWRQPGLDAENAIAIRVSLGDTTTLYVPDELDEYEEFIPASAQPSEGRNSTVTTSTINGTIKVRLGRFLHMDTLLVFTDTQTQQSFRLAQSRKMRSGELHYIDNSRFGLLTRITPLEDSVSAGASDSATDSSSNQNPVSPTVE